MTKTENILTSVAANANVKNDARKTNGLNLRILVAPLMYPTFSSSLRQTSFFLYLFITE
jgi:hypothetical protein